MKRYKKPICELCKKEILVKRPRDRFKRFCDRKCSSRFLFLLPLVKCPICKKEMSQTKYRKYCSTTCYGESQKSKYQKECLYCKKKFILNNRAYEKRGSGKYCSPKCGYLAQRRYTINENFFKKIDSEKKAFWLGFLMADGYNSNYEVIINLQKRDRFLLDEFLKDIGSNVKIKNRKDNDNIITLRVYSPKTCKYLSALGCVKRKSFVLKYPDIPNRLDRHFIRGFFDGDGCISYESGKSEHRRRVDIFSVSTDFIDSIENVLRTNGINVLREKSRMRLNICRQDQIQLFREFLYKNSHIYLQRKREKFFFQRHQQKLRRHQVEIPKDLSFSVVT